MRLLSIVLLLSFTLAAPAFAQGSDDAAAVYERAQQKFAAGDIPGALEDYRQTVEMMGANPSWEVLANYSNAAFQLRLLAESAHALREADRRLPLSEPGYDELKAKFAARMAEILPHVAQLSVTVEPAGAEVFVDGKSQGRAPLADTVFVMPGAREVQALLAGYDPSRDMVPLRAGETATVSLRLEPVRATVPPGPSGDHAAPEDGISPTRLGLGITAIGLGIAGSAAAVVLGVTASDRNDSVTELQARADSEAGSVNSCGAGSPALSSNTCHQLFDFLDERDRFKSAAIGVGVVGGALLVGGIITLVLPTDENADTAFAISPLGSSIRGKF